MKGRVLACGAAVVTLMATLSTAAPADDESKDVPPPFARFEAMIGGWKGTAQPTANRLKGWPEKHAWAWKFAKGVPVGMTITVQGGKVFTKGELTFDTKTSRYNLAATDPAGKPVVFAGAPTPDGKGLVLDRTKPTPAGKQRLTIRPNASGIRYTMLVDLQAAGAPQYKNTLSVGLTKEGEAFAAGGEPANLPKCILTGGSASMTVTFNGKSYPVCCTGCRDEFNESPEKYLKKASLLSSQAGQAKSNQPVSAKVSRFEDAFAGDIPPSAAEPSRMSNRQTVTKPELKKPAEKSEPAANAEVSAKVKSPNKNSTDKSAAAKRISRAATLLQIAQNLENHGKAEAALKNFKQIVKDFPGTPAAKTAAERIKALDVD
jgi:YHS domain-containing protein